ncbi:glycine cleavage system protein H [Stygiolobus caldivivus]|uniref:Probable glycine cleavage system H protein n=1 Tax=Stygiolobus caldivivus TaxID=2824673 RepID=A0A8D5ZDI7_9CREN|nr:glycine cleavage system protein H [Stygiolobus caldivivus]BCU69133.1 glycine cleavage system protein H [Stygiolobus caldivivus]
MNINGFEFPEDLLYYPEEHVWIKIEGDIITVGITSLGQYMAGKIFEVSTKNKGEKINSRSVIFTLESAKWVGKFRLPLEGEIVEVNEAVIKNPALLNDNPYEAWIVKVKGVYDDKKLKKIDEVSKLFEAESSRVVR